MKDEFNLVIGEMKGHEESNIDLDDDWRTVKT
jgi:hypothetical protein